MRGLWTWPPWVIFAPAFYHKIGLLEGYFTEKCISGDLQRWTNSRWLTDGSDHNRNNNATIWPTIFYDFLAAIPMLKVPQLCLRNKHVFISFIIKATTSILFIEQIIFHPEANYFTKSPKHAVHVKAHSACPVTGSKRLEEWAEGIHRQGWDKTVFQFSRDSRFPITTVMQSLQLWMINFFDLFWRCFLRGHFAKSPKQAVCACT